MKKNKIAGNFATYIFDDDLIENETGKSHNSGINPA